MADLFFIPVFTSSLLTSERLPCADAAPGQQKKCSRDALFNRLEVIAPDASATSYLRRFNGADHFLVSGHQGNSYSAPTCFEFKHTDQRLGRTMQFAMEEPVKLPMNVSWPAPNRPSRRYHSYPWSGAVHFPVSTPWSQLSWRDGHQRQVLIGTAFGLAKRTQIARFLRQILFLSCQRHPSSVCTILHPPTRDSDSQALRDAKKGANGAATEVTAFMMASLYYNSTFCLQPLGDGPTRAGIIEALLLGCIPVLFHPAQLQWPLHAPWLRNATVILDVTAASAPSHRVDFAPSASQSGGQSGGLDFRKWPHRLQQALELGQHLDVVQALKSIPARRIARMQRTIAEHGHCIHYFVRSEGSAAGDSEVAREPRGTLEDEPDAFSILLDTAWYRSSRLKGAGIEAPEPRIDSSCRPVPVPVKAAVDPHRPRAASRRAERVQRQQHETSSPPPLSVAQQLDESGTTCPLDAGQPSTRATQMTSELDGEVAFDYYRHWPQNFDNKADLHALIHLLRELGSKLCSSPCFTLIVGGLNLGDAARLVFEACPSARLHAFEIQHQLYRAAVPWFRKYPNARLRNLGMGNVSGAHYKVFIPGNAREGAGFYQTWRGITKPLTTATTVRLFEYAREHNLSQVHYGLIDVEGFEPCVMEGMALHTSAGQYLFPVFQWEATDAWDDSRHPAGAMNRAQQLTALRAWGYESYAIGTSSPCGISRRGQATLLDRACNATAVYLPVSPGFPFMRKPVFVGNILSIHHRFANQRLLSWVRQRAVSLAVPGTP